MPKTPTQGAVRRAAARTSPLAAAATRADTLRPPTGARRKGVLEHAGAWVTHDALPAELSGAEVVRELRALLGQSESERGTMHGRAWCSGDRRRTLQVSDSGAAYRYAGSAWQGRPVLRFSDAPVVARLRDAMERATGTRFNFVLLNFYNDEGRLGWHQDDEKGHVAGAPIASFSVCAGAPWAFDLRVKAEPATKWRIPIASGDLVVMGGACQRVLEHQVPALKRPPGDWRINLTFRQFVQ